VTIESKRLNHIIGKNSITFGWWHQIYYISVVHNSECLKIPERLSETANQMERLGRLVANLSIENMSSDVISYRSLKS
jgi:hypothetical protein